jgi:UDP-N-acetylglucosamine 2-epimerase (non-hydrolysing)
MMRRILSVVGARPNFMKVAPVHRALARYADVESRILHTGQHYDRVMSDVFFEDLALPEPDIYLGCGSGTHAEQTAAIMVAFERHVVAERPALVAVYGDVNSTLACALVCAKLGIPIAHVEAGLRSFDRAMPEEINRVVTDHLADLLLVTEPSGRRNLEREGIALDRVVETGNVMIDSLVEVLQQEGIEKRRPRVGRPLVVVTLHRPSNVDEPERLAGLARLLCALGREHDVLFPVHPRTRSRLEATGIGADLNGHVQLVNPLGYRAFVRLLAEAALVVTDSGGVQEESAYLGVPCLTLRRTTERPITVDAGTNMLEPQCGGDLPGAARDLMSRAHPGIGENPVLLGAQWDGHAGARIAALIRTLARAQR